MAQASMNAKGFASNRFVKESVDPGKDKILFGGAKHKDGGRKSGDWKFRPETIKTFSCEGEECTECTDPSSCWHGRGAGTLELKVPPTNPNSRFVFEAWASCGKGGGKWDLTVRNFANGHYSVYINGVLDWEITEAQFKKEKKKWFLRKTIRFTKDAHVRVEFFRTDSTLDAFARVASVPKGLTLTSTNAWESKIASRNLEMAAMMGSNSAARISCSCNALKQATPTPYLPLAPSGQGACQKRIS